MDEVEFFILLFVVPFHPTVITALSSHIRKLPLLVCFPHFCTHICFVLHSLWFLSACAFTVMAVAIYPEGLGVECGCASDFGGYGLGVAEYLGVEVGGIEALSDVFDVIVAALCEMVWLAVVTMHR